MTRLAEFNENNFEIKKVCFRDIEVGDIVMIWRDWTERLEPWIVTKTGFTLLHDHKYIDIQRVMRTFDTNNDRILETEAIASQIENDMMLQFTVMRPRKKKVQE